VLLADGASYIAEGKSMKRFGMEVETGLSYKLNRKTDIGLFYTGKFKKEYTDHTGTLSVNYAF
ncbi:MAG: autotransporter outer membrane beta-barrel domain-containing protein, partial [Alphaproteobacteria bacterium]